MRAQSNPTEGNYGAGWLEERQLSPRWPLPITHVVNIAVLLGVFSVTWWIFQDPRGLMRLYTPYVGYMYTRWLLIILIWMVYIFQFWPMKRAQLESWHPLIKGAVAVAAAFAVMMIVIHGFFQKFLGSLGIAYFNPEITSQFPRMTRFFAEEYAALAILMFAALASWLAPAWVVGMERAPWQHERQPVQGFTILIVTFFLSTLLYFVTMHPHMGILYYPWQQFTAVAPPTRFSTPVNVALRTLIVAVGGVLLMIFYYNISPLVLGTQRGVSQPEQFPMIPTIWLINIMLVHHWYMDNWPAWRVSLARSAAEDRAAPSLAAVPAE